ncbi:MAG: iron-siderophore ABC transporter substrate-binding protein [Chloroflexota bacterium]
MFRRQVILFLVLVVLIGCQVVGGGETAVSADIPANPQRIIAADEGTMVDLLALGVTPVGVNDFGRRDFSRFLDYDADAIASVGTPDGPNYEAILVLEPDLIIAREEHFTWTSPRMRSRLEAIAPVAVSPHSGAPWDEHLRFVAQLVNKEAEAEELIATYETRLQEFRTAWAAAGGGETIGIVRSRPNGLQVYAKESFIAETVKSADLTMPDGFEELPRRNNISLEELDTLSSDYLFVMMRNEDEAVAFLEASASPLWEFLPAVQNEQVHQVNWSVWVAGWNVVGAQLVLDDLFFFLLDSESPTPNPITALVRDDFNPQFDVERLE